MKAIWLKTEEGSRDVQATHGGSFQIKHPSPLPLMHYTYSTSRINDKMTLEQCPYTLHPTLPPQAKQWWNKYLRISDPPSGRQGCNPSSYIYSRKDSPKRGSEKLREKKERGIRNCVTKRLVIIRTTVPWTTQGESLNNTPYSLFLLISS